MTALVGPEPTRRRPWCGLEAGGALVVSRPPASGAETKEKSRAEAAWCYLRRDDVFERVPAAFRGRGFGHQQVVPVVRELLVPGSGIHVLDL